MYQYGIKLNRVVDGDTIDVDIDLGFKTWIKKERVRLLGIDAPECRTRDKEEKQRGIASKKFLQQQLQGKILLIETYLMEGKYGRTLGRIYAGGVDINKLMLTSGHAKEYKSK
jgi:micrococcal nuclease